MNFRKYQRYSHHFPHLPDFARNQNPKTRNLRAFFNLGAFVSLFLISNIYRIKDTIWNTNYMKNRRIQKKSSKEAFNFYTRLSNAPSTEVLDFYSQF